jgi:hypothetical protein
MIDSVALTNNDRQRGSNIWIYPIYALSSFFLTATAMMMVVVVIGGSYNYNYNDRRQQL